MTTAVDAAWAAALARNGPPALGPAQGRVVAVAAHPDDETLGAAGYLRAVHAAGGSVEIVVATDGEAAFPASSPAERARLGRARRAELDAALAALGLSGARVTWLGLPDSALADHEDELTRQLGELLSGSDVCLAPWPEDPHPDHGAAGRATLRAAPAGAHRLCYPIWMWARTDPGDPVIPWATAHRFPLDDDSRRAKAEAIQRFATQLAAAPGGGPPILPPDALAHFATGSELFFRMPPDESAPAARFAELYAAGADPWDTRTGWYEERKRAIVAACLPRPRYRHAAEPGCGLGLLTGVLVGRCDRVTASDYVPDAVEETRTVVPDATAVHAALPDPASLPAGVDLVVLSEVLYYLASAVVDEVVDRVARVLPAGGDVVLVHWRGVAAEAPLSAAAAHRRMVDDPRFRVVVEHVDEEFLLHVLRRCP